MLLRDQCYAWTEYKFTCVCVSVCQSHFLSSVVLPTGQTPQRIFTVDSLKDANYASMCLSGSRWWVITFTGPNSPTPRFLGAWIGISSKMRKIQIAISSDLCIRLTWNLTGSYGQQQRLRGWSCMVVKQFQDGGRPPFWKSIYSHISAKNHPIFMKFCTQQQILNWMNVAWSKMKKLHWTDSEFDRTYFLFSYISRF